MEILLVILALLFVAWVAPVLFGIIAVLCYLANIFQLFSTVTAGLAILKAIGIFLPPLGAILGFAGFF